MFNIRLLTSFLSGSILFESYWQVIFRLIFSYFFSLEDSLL